MNKTITVEDSCLICAQKHVTAARRALHEPGYELSEDAHDFAIGELVLAENHLREDWPDLTEKIRKIRHYVQYWKYDKIEIDWKDVCHIINTEIIKNQNILMPFHIPRTITNIPANSADSLSGQKTAAPLSSTGKIYIFSNVAYPEKNKIHPRNGDILIFLNKAVSANYYLNERTPKFVYHRSPKKDYGEVVPGFINQYVFDEGNRGIGLPKDFIERLKKDYDWNYEIEQGKVKSMTTGYMVVKWLAEQYPKHQIVLVNFGYEVNKSTYRCPWHNWEFEAEQLKSFEHVYLEEGKNEQK